MQRAGISVEGSTILGLVNSYIIWTGLEGDATYISQTGLILPRVKDDGNMGLVRAIYVVSPEI